MRPRSGTFAAANAEPLVVFTSEWGSIALGLVAHDVVFACFVEDISESIAARCARRLERILTGDVRYTVFMDAYSPDGGNLGARAQIARALIARRDKVASTVTLVRTESVADSARLLSEMLQVPAIITTDHHEFDRMLVEAAPDAHQRIHPDNCVPAPIASEPPLRLVHRA
ncbi:MAG TPA: hypothetical protein VFZ53_22515 [Polyangiaceae bacterium]